MAKNTKQNEIDDIFAEDAANSAENTAKVADVTAEANEKEKVAKIAADIANAAATNSVQAKQAADKAFMESRIRKTLEAWKNAPKRKVLGNKLYAPYLGNVYSYCLNNIPVTIKLDGTMQEFPEPVAANIEQKLNEVAVSNVGQVRNDEISKG